MLSGLLRAITITASLIAVTSSTQGSFFYVSPSGSDANSGTLGSPFKTLGTALPHINPGDTLYLRAGTYRETLTAKISGTSSSPISISAYSNEVVVITGGDLVTNTWFYTSNGIYATRVSWDWGEGYNQVFVDGIMQHEAQYPNWTATNTLLNPPTINVTVSTNYFITNTAFAALGDLSGAIFLGGVDLNWAWQYGVISSNSASTLYVNSNAVNGGWWWPNATSTQSASGFGLIFGKLSLLDADNEWFLDSTTTNLFLRMSGGVNPGSHRVELKHRTWCVDMNGKSFVGVHGIQTRAGAIRLNGDGDVLEGCDAGYLSHFLRFYDNSGNNGGRTEGGGVVVGANYCEVRGCVIHDTAGSGIVVSGTSNIITHNHVFTTDYSGTYAEGLILSGTNHTVSYNTIHDSGRDILQPGGKGHSITYNELYGCGWLAKDLGTIYVWGNNALDSNGKKTRIAYNWIHDGHPTLSGHRGLYFDNYSRNYIVDHNVIWNFVIGTTPQDGIFLNSPKDGMELYHNTVFNCIYNNHFTALQYPKFNPDTNYWTATNEHLFYKGQNNLVLTSSNQVAATLVSASGTNFALLASSSAMNPVTTNYTIAWSSTNGYVGVAPGFTLWMNSGGYLFSYQETGGNGMVISGINDGYLGVTPDNGAYEYGGSYWQPGTNGSAVGIVSPSPPVLTVTSLQGTPMPGGVTTNSYGTVIDAYVASPIVNGTTQYVATGWTGSGSVGSGTGTNVSFIITNNSTLTWLWLTNVWVSLNVIGN